MRALCNLLSFSCINKKSINFICRRLEIDPKILSELGDIDILFVPIGGDEVLEVPQASKLATKLEAKVIIPMHYDAVALKAFLKEEGAESTKPAEKLTLKRKDVAGESGTVMVLK